MWNKSTIIKMVSGTSDKLIIVFITICVCLNVCVLSASAEYSNQTITTNRTSPAFSTGNKLWDNLIQDCLRKPTFSCIQKNVYNYLDDTLNVENVNISNRILFRKNLVDYTKYTKEANEKYYDDITNNEIPDMDGRSMLEVEPDSPIEEVTTALKGKSAKFMLTHDVDIKLPEIMFDGATFRIQPRSFEGTGMIAKLELIPRTEVEARNTATGRILLKPIKKFFKNKLVLAVLAIIVIIKIIKIKIMWILPFMIGVTATKKLVLKFMLFLFPALAHIFKLCAYYHQSFHKPNFHHHQHHIKHLHTFHPDLKPHHGGHHHGPELIFTKPPTGHPAEYLHGAPVPPHTHIQPDWEFSGPGLGSEAVVKPHPVYGAPIVQKRTPTAAASQIISQYASAPTAADDVIVREAQKQEHLRIQHEQKLIAKQQQIINAQAFVNENQTPRPVDAFYSPILQRLDKIFVQLSIHEEPCRERLVCSMYKNPLKFSPHSNYISAELSRDANELEKPSNTNAAVMRFYRYVQAARDGQDQRDCLRLYPQCAINTEIKK